MSAKMIALLAWMRASEQRLADSWNARHPR